MDRRLKLHEELCNILGSRNVYFQPPETVKMKYPCIVYSRTDGDTTFANDMPYTFERRYNVTIIDLDPDSEIIEKMAHAFQKCIYDRHFTADNLNHDIFKIYY